MVSCSMALLILVLSTWQSVPGAHPSDVRTWWGLAPVIVEILGVREVSREGSAGLGLEDRGGGVQVGCHGAVVLVGAWWRWWR